MTQVHEEKRVERHQISHKITVMVDVSRTQVEISRERKVFVFAELVLFSTSAILILGLILTLSQPLSTIDSETLVGILVCIFGSAICLYVGFERLWILFSTPKQFRWRVVDRVRT